MTDIKTTKNRRKKESKRPTDDIAGYAVLPEPPVAETSVATRASVAEDERRRMIAEAAYYRAQRRGFAEGSPERDWLEAEAEIVALLANAGLRT